jgi:hypothetical protein
MNTIFILFVKMLLAQVSNQDVNWYELIQYIFKYKSISFRLHETRNHFKLCQTVSVNQYSLIMKILNIDTANWKSELP